MRFREGRVEKRNKRRVAQERKEERKGEEGRVEEIGNKGIRKSKNRRTKNRKSMIVEQCRERVVCSMVDWNRVE